MDNNPFVNAFRQLDGGLQRRGEARRRTAGGLQPGRNVKLVPVKYSLKALHDAQELLEQQGESLHILFASTNTVQNAVDIVMNKEDLTPENGKAIRQVSPVENLNFVEGSNQVNPVV